MTYKYNQVSSRTISRDWTVIILLYGFITLLFLSVWLGLTCYQQGGAPFRIVKQVCDQSQFATGKQDEACKTAQYASGTKYMCEPGEFYGTDCYVVEIKR